LINKEKRANLVGGHRHSGHRHYKGGFEKMPKENNIKHGAEKMGNDLEGIVRGEKCPARPAKKTFVKATYSSKKGAEKEKKSS